MKLKLQMLGWIQDVREVGLTYRLPEVVPCRKFQGHPPQENA